MNETPLRQNGQTHDARALERRRVFKAGLIEIKNQSSIECVVRNLTRIGAKLEVAEGYWIPEHFVLRIPSEGIRSPCEVRWRRATGLGVNFIAD